MIQVRYLLIISLLLFSCSKKKEIKEKEITTVKSEIIKPRDTVTIIFKDTIIKSLKTTLKKSDKLKVIINGKAYYKKNIGDTPYHNRYDEEGSETFIYKSINTNHYYDIRTPNVPQVCLVADKIKN